jgi:hypothetical protein
MFAPATEMVKKNLQRVIACSLVAAVQIGSLAMATTARAANGQRVDLRVLVVTNGDAATGAITQELTTEGVPYTQVDLTNGGRPTVNAAFLSDTVNSIPRAKFQAVILPNDNPGLSANELSALHSYEVTFGIRQVDADAVPSANVGLNSPSYTGSLNGVTATASTIAAGGAFSYLKGPIAFDAGSFGSLATPVDATKFASVVTTSSPANGSLVGVYSTRDLREEMVITTDYNFNQTQFRLLAHGIITWVTRGVHLGYNRNFFSLHVDDLFLPDSRWSTTGHCTPGDDCPPGSPITTQDIRLTSTDLTNLINWQNANNFRITWAFNGSGSDQYITDNGSDPVLTSVLANKANFTFVNHTFTHLYLGCVQDFTVIPWRCAGGPTTPTWTSSTDINNEITQNISWAASKGIPINASELVSGEHSGLRTAPQEPSDNPNFISTLNADGILVTGSDDSREHDQRVIGTSTKTLPRHPMNVFYNVATAAEEVNEYNWIYTSAADGGSGICTNNPSSTCIAPLSESTGYQSYIVPTERDIALQHILADDPRPHYAHQSNFAEGRIAYNVLDAILAKYNAEFASNTPIVNPSMTQSSVQLSNMSAFNLNQSNVTAYTYNGELYANVNSGSLNVPVTVPSLATTVSPKDPYGESYAGERSAWQSVSHTANDTAIAIIGAGPVDAAHSTVVANPTSLLANGVATSTVTVSLKDVNDLPVPAKTVTLAGNKNAVISAASGPSDANGVMTFTVKSTKSGPEVFTATDSTDALVITQTATVTFNAGSVSASKSTVSANPMASSTHGRSSASITVTLKDDMDNPVSGKTVTLSGNSYSDITPVSDVSDTNGHATFTAHSTVSGVETFSARDLTDGISLSDTADVNFAKAPDNGYWLLGTDGGIFSFGEAQYYGSTGAMKLNQPIVGMASTPTANGYWLVASDGGVFSFGDAQFYGSTGAMTLNKPIVGMTSTVSGNGYWLVASDGGIFTFGDAKYFGSTGAMTLNKPIVGMAATPTGKGYWLVASDGGIFTFGDAKYFGSTGAMTLNKPIVGMAATPTQKGYWLVASDGGVFSFGDAQFYGSTGGMKLNKPIVGMIGKPSGAGYWLVASDGGIFSFGDDTQFYGSTGAMKLNDPITSGSVSSS